MLFGIERKSNRNRLYKEFILIYQVSFRNWLLWRIALEIGGSKGQRPDKQCVYSKFWQWIINWTCLIKHWDSLYSRLSTSVQHFKKCEGVYLFIGFLRFYARSFFMPFLCAIFAAVIEHSIRTTGDDVKRRPVTTGHSSARNSKGNLGENKTHSFIIS